jgi:hypothetical protein
LPNLEKLTEMIPSVASFVKLLNLGFGWAIYDNPRRNHGWLRVEENSRDKYADFTEKAKNVFAEKPS